MSRAHALALAALAVLGLAGPALGSLSLLPGASEASAGTTAPQPREARSYDVPATGQPVEVALEPGVYELTAAGTLIYRYSAPGLSDAAYSWEFSSGQRCLPFSLMSVNHLPPWAAPLTPDLPSNIVFTTVAFYGLDPAPCDEANHTYRAHLVCLPPGCHLHLHVHDSNYGDNRGSIQVAIATIP